MPFEISHHIRKWVIGQELCDAMQMVWHNDKYKELHSLTQPKTIQHIEQETLCDITLK